MVLPDRRSSDVSRRRIHTRALDSQLNLQHMHWMARQFAMGEDVMLIGPPGALRRQLIERLCALRALPYELVSITRDTSVSDLQQRRELTDGSTRFEPGPVLRACLAGKLLVVDGLNKAEPNVLPMLNELLESRRMQLDDG